VSWLFLEHSITALRLGDLIGLLGDFIGLVLVFFRTGGDIFLGISGEARCFGDTIFCGFFMSLLSKSLFLKGAWNEEGFLLRVDDLN